jgi:hypothetical protein
MIVEIEEWRKTHFPKSLMGNKSFKRSTQVCLCGCMNVCVCVSGWMFSTTWRHVVRMLTDTHPSMLTCLHRSKEKITHRHVYDILLKAATLGHHT